MRFTRALPEISSEDSLPPTRFLPRNYFGRHPGTLDPFEGFFCSPFVKKITKFGPNATHGRGDMDFSLSTYYPIFLYLVAWNVGFQPLNAV